DLDRAELRGVVRQELALGRLLRIERRPPLLVGKPGRADVGARHRADSTSREQGDQLRPQRILQRLAGEEAPGLLALRGEDAAMKRISLRAAIATRSSALRPPAASIGSAGTKGSYACQSHSKGASMRARCR